MTASKAIDPKVIERLAALIAEAEASRDEGPSIPAETFLRELRQRLDAERAPAGPAVRKNAAR